MAQEPVGYSHLIEQFRLPARQPAIVAVIDSAAKGRKTAKHGDTELLQFEPRYRPKPTLAAQLQFALRYEGLNLEVLALLFAKTGRHEIEANLAEKPESSFARRIGFLYEWLTGEKLNAAVAPRAAYVRVVDEALQFGLIDGSRDRKFRVINNLPGNRQFCPMVRKTGLLQEMVGRNGRLHRFLIHDVLSSSGFTPKGIVLPVSAVILAHQKEYADALERFSKSLQARTTYNPDLPETPATGNDALYFRHFDATDQASFLYWALERAVEQDLEEEIAYLLGFDTARTALKDTLDWPAHSLDLFIRLVHQNQGSLSKTKRQSHFSWMTDEEIKQSEGAVMEAFGRKNVH